MSGVGEVNDGSNTKICGVNRAVMEII